MNQLIIFASLRFKELQKGDNAFKLSISVKGMHISLEFEVYFTLARTGKGLTSWLSFEMFNCAFVTSHCGILGHMWYLIVSIPDFCPLSYFLHSVL